MGVSEEYSLKVKHLSFLAMIGVVLIHANTISGINNLPSWCTISEMLLTRTFIRWAVPFFFVVSGFFFGNGSYIKKGGYSSLIKKKIKTLLIPYFIWAIWGIILVTFLVCANNYISHNPILYNTVFDTTNIAWGINNALGILAYAPKCNQALWYVRVLLIIFSIAPLLRLLYKLNIVFLFLLSFLLIFGGFFLGRPEYLQVSFVDIGWFMLGLCVSKFGIEKIRFNNVVMYISGLLYVIIAGFQCFMSLRPNGVDISSTMLYLDTYEGLFGIIFWWNLYDKIKLFFNIFPDTLINSTFFVYCMHQPIIAYFLSVTRMFAKNNPLVLVASTFFSVFAVISICYFFRRIIYNKLNKFYMIISGGR